MSVSEDRVVKNRILLVVRWPVGGIRTFLKYVYGLFNEDTWSLTIVAPDCEELQALKNDLENINVSFLVLDKDPSFFQFTLAIFKELLRNKYNVVHSQGFTSAISAVVPATLFGKPHVLTSHDVINDGQFKGWGGTIKRIALGGALVFSKIIHSVSYDAENNLRSFFPKVKKDKWITIPNGIQIQRFIEASPKDFRAGNNNLSDKILIGFFGRFMGQKGFRYIIDAVDILANKTRIPQMPVIMAFGWGGFIREEQEIIRKKELDNFFKFMPFESNIASAIKGLDVVLMPSLWEACPLLPMETLVCGTPLISTKCVGLREVIAGTPTMTIDMKSGESIAQAIVQFMSSPSKQKFSDYVMPASKRYDVANQSDKIKQIYNNLAS